MGTLLRFLACSTLFGYALSNYNTIVSHERNCPSDWRYFDHKCYLLTAHLTFDAARTYCLDLSADLVVYDYRMELMMTQQWNSNNNVDHWVGMQMENGEEFHTWFDGKKVSETYTRWKSGEPNEGTSSNVAYMTDYYMYDAPNSGSKYTLCEKRANTADAQSKCAHQGEIRSLAGPVMMAMDDEYDRSLTKCSQSCLLQAYSYSALIDELCVCMSSKPNSRTCRGAAEEMKVYYEYTTDDRPDDFAITVSQPSNMDCEDPSHTYYNGHCYTYVTDPLPFFDHILAAQELYGDDATIVSINNEAEARFIDEVLLSSENRIGDNKGNTFYVGVYDDRNVCDEGWAAYDGGCYRYLSTKDSYANHSVYCQGLKSGADLVWFEDSNEQAEAMNQFMPTNHKETNIEVWSGLYNLNDDENGAKDWKYPMWSNQAGHTEWSGEGTDLGERCAIMRSNERYVLFDRSCEDEYAAICRYNIRERDIANFEDFVNMDHEPVSESYSRWLPGQGYNLVPNCAYHNSEYKFWSTCACVDSKEAIYEYPAVDSDYTSRGGEIVDAFTKIEATMTHYGGPISENSVSFECDGQFDWDKPFTSFSHVVRELGQHEVLFDSTDFWYQRSNGSATYEVVLPVEGSNVVCPLLVDTTYEMECAVASTGESPSGVVDFGDGKSTESVELQGSTLVVVGPNIRRQSSTTTGQTTDDQSNVMYNSPFNQYGLIQAFEFDAIQSGTFHFVVWRPRCGEEEVFCSKSMACHPIEYKFDTCETVINRHKTDCGSGVYKWSLSARACVDSNGERVEAASRYHGAMEYNELDKVGEHITSTERRGRHFITLTRYEMIEVQPGDVLGFIGVDGRLADYYVGEPFTGYSGMVDKTWFPESGGSNWHYEFFLNAHVATYHHLMVRHSYDIVGDKNVTQDTTNDYSVVDGVGTRPLTVYERLGDMAIIDIGPPGRSIITKTDENFTVNVHLGEPVTYDWDFADGTEIITETTGTVTHAFELTGRYNVTVRGYNELSEDMAWTKVLVQAEIQVGTPTQFDSSTELEDRTVFKYCIDDGNEVTYTLSVDLIQDGTPYPDVFVYEVEPRECLFGFMEGANYTCYQKTNNVGNFTEGANSCDEMYNRSYPAYYDSKEEFKLAYDIYGTQDMFSGYHRREDGAWYNWFGLELETFPTFNEWIEEPVTDNCVTHYDGNDIFQPRSCEDDRHMMCMYEGKCQIFSIELGRIGVYSIQLSAENEVSYIEHTYTQYVENPIEGLVIHPIPSQRWGDVVTLNITWTKGSRLHATCHNGDNGTYEECDDFVFYPDLVNGLAGYGTITIDKDEYKVINNHTRFIHFYNMISSMTTTITFTVMYEILEMDIISSHSCAITIEDEVTYTLSFLQMSHGTLTYTYADQTSPESDIVEYIAEMTDEAVDYPDHAATPKYIHDIKHNYPVEGTYIVTVNISNDISEATISKSIVIENPIRGYRYEKTSPVAIWPGEIAMVNITLIFDKTHILFNGKTHLVPTDVTQSYTYGAPDCTEIYGINECNTNNGGCDHLCVNTDTSYYCMCNFNYHLDSDGETCLYGNATNNMTTAAAAAAGPTTQGALLTTADMWYYMGTRCPEGTHTDMVRVNESVTDIDSFDYTHYGTFTVNLNFENCISDHAFEFTVDIDQPVMNLSIVSDEYILPWTSNSTLTINMDWGSRIALTYDFKDTHPKEHYTYNRLYPNTVTHLWDVEGTYYPTITAVNLIDTWEAVTGPVYIQYILAEALRVETKYIWAIPYPAYEKLVYFDVYLKAEYADMMPTNVTANVTFGDWDPVTEAIAVLNNQYLPDVAQFNETFDYPDGDRHVWTFVHLYTVGHTYNVTIDFQNWVSSLSVDVEYHSIEEVAPPTVNAMILDSDLLEISDDAVDWSFPLHSFIDCKQLKELSSKPCIFALREVLGVLNTEIRDSRDSSNATGLLQSTYKHPPTNETIRRRIDEVVFFEYLNGENDLSQEELNILVSDSLNIRSNLNETQAALFDEFLLALEMNPPLGVANISLLTGTDINELIDKVAFSDWLVRQQYSYDKNSVIDSLYEAYIQPGDKMYSYPIEEAVTVYLIFPRGTHYSVYWDWGDNFTEITNFPFASHRYAKPDVYTLKLTVFNSVSSVTSIRPINIQRSVMNVSFTGGPDIVTRNHTNRWSFDLGNIGTDACYLINFKDEGTEEFPNGNRYFFIGHKDACQHYYALELSIWPQQVTWMTNEANEHEKEEHGAVIVYNSFMFGSLGTYRVSFTGVNRVSSERAIFPVAVTKGPCFRPLVLLRSQNPCEPNCVNGDEKAQYKAQDIDLRTAVGYNCTTTQLADHDWHIYQIHDNGTEVELHPVNLTLFSAYYDVPIRKLKIPSLTFDYGTYKFTLNVTMYDEDVWKQDEMILHIVRTPLKVAINAETTMIYDKYKFETNYTLDAFTYTGDPDKPYDREGWFYVWRCRRYCESFPVYDEDFNVIHPMESQCDEVNSTYVVSHDGTKDGGCFIGDGYHESGFFTTSNEGILVLDLSFVYELDLIEFTVDITKEDRTRHLAMYLEISPGIPPQIDPDLCISNCKEKVNYEAIYSMNCRIIKARGEYNYLWQLYRGITSDFNDPSTVEIPSTEFNKNLPTDGSKESMVQTGTSQQSFAFEPGFFTIADVDDYFFVTVMAWKDGRKLNSGLSMTRFQVNEPPQRGNCTAFPLNGTAAETKFTVECSDFYDQHKPVQYQTGYRNPGTVNIMWGNQRISAFDPAGGMVLGEGTKNKDYTVELYIRAEDNIGGKTVSEPMIVQVLPASIDLSAANVDDLAGGDPSEAAGRIAAMIGGFNTDEEEELPVIEVVNKDEMTEEELAAYDQAQEERRIKRAQKIKDFREKLATALSRLPLDSLEVISAVNQAAQHVGSKPDELTLRGLSYLVGVGTKGISVLAEMAENLDAGQMNEKCTEALSAQARAVEAASAQQSEDAKDPVAAAERRRKRREEGLPTIDDISMAVQAAFTACSELVSGLKVAGEGDTVMDADNVKVSVMKQHSSAFDDGKMASGGDGDNGIALPSSDKLLGNTNESSAVIQSLTNNYNSLPFNPKGSGENYTGDTLPTGQILQIVLQDEFGNPLNGSSNDTAPTSHVFMAREDTPTPLTIVAKAAMPGETPVPHKIFVPNKTAIQMKLKRSYDTPNITTNGTASNVTTTTTAAPSARRKRSLEQDPFLDTSPNVTRNYTIFDDLTLIFQVYMRLGKRPTEEVFDFSCILPVRFYSIDENTTVALGGTIRHNIDCDAIWLEDENATCEVHTINRDIYPLDKEVVDTDDTTCYIPDSWLAESGSDLELFTGITYYYINSTKMDSLENITYDEFARGYMPEMIPFDLPDEYEEEGVYYDMEVSASSCKYWSPFHEDYISDGCQVGPLTETTLTHCICDVLSPAVPPYVEEKDENGEVIMPVEEYERKVKLAADTPGIAFGGGISIPMNTIDVNNSAFNNLGENPLIFSLMVSIMCLYLCSLIWAYAQDRKDAFKAGVSPLLDNDPRDKYLYEVTVYTGSRTGSSTTAKISMVFSGEEDETQPRLIYDDKRPVLQSGGVDGFVMATPRSLGSLSHIRVWHDNSGKSPGWFFSRLQVVDMQTLEKYFFILDRWLSAAEDDGIIDRIVPLAGKDELTGFSHLFFTKARKDLMDGHIWFSIFGKPHKSNFTRCQRLTCCLALLFASMMANILLYRDPTEDEAGTALRIGPISLTLQQILSGILSSIIVFPINILIVLIFKNTKEPPFDLGKRCCSPCKKSKKKSSNPNRFAADELAHQAKLLDGAKAESRAASFASLGSVTEGETAVDEYISEEAKKRNQKFKLPWGFLFVAYFLALCVTAVSFWYTVEVGATFGPKKSAEWTGSFCTSIVESIFMSQPLKVLGIALFYALVIKKPAADDDVDPGLEKGQEYLHKHEKQCQKLDQHVRKRLNKYKNVPMPPTEEYLAAARALRQKELKMMDVLKEIFLYVVFLNLLMMVSYGNRDPAGHALYNALYDEFHDAVYVPNNGLEFTKVTEYKSFWAYCNQTLLPSLWPAEWYDGVSRDPEYTADRNMYRVGSPRLRQLRMLSEQCGMPMYRYTKECNNGYDLLSEDTGIYYPGWIPVANVSEPEYLGPYPGWFWESSSDLEGFPFQGMAATYGGGGFNIELGSTLEQAQLSLNTLRDEEWLTPETRAVVVEFVLYNANMNLFAVSSMTFEFLNTGSVVPVYKMNLIRLDRYIGTYMITVMVSEILTFLYVFYFIYTEIKQFRADKKKYFKSFWNIIEFVTLLLCIVALAMFFARFAFVKKTATNFRENTASFTSFQFATTWEEIYSYLLAFIIFFANVKFLKLLRFNKKMSMLGMTMMYIGKPLLSFLMALGIVFLAFAQMAYLVYCRLLLNFSTFIAASTTLFTLMLNKFDYKALEDANAVFAPIIFFSFTILVSFVMLSFMITIILEGFMEVTEELKQKENEYEIVSFIVTKFKGAVGLGKNPELPPMNREPDAMVSENHAELMDRFDDFEEMFRDFCSDENRGDEPLVAKYEKEIMMAKRLAKNRTIYST